MTILESILKSLHSAASYNKHELAAPRVILWPDEERLWTQCIEPLRASYAALWSLGDYAPDKATGPAAWLRYQLETQGGEDVPVIYLPGIGRSAFRSADQCPNQAKHFFALQFQGQFWTQKKGKTGRRLRSFRVQMVDSVLMSPAIRTRRRRFRRACQSC